MLDPRKGFVRLPGEELVYQSPARTSLSITTSTGQAVDKPVSIQSTAGTAHITNQRVSLSKDLFDKSKQDVQVIYLPAMPTNDFQSFSAPLLNLHDSHVVMPWFGSNSWQAVLQPVPGGNLPSSHAKIEVKLVFNEGGAPDFHSNLERIKERLQQAVEAARDGGSGSGPGIGSLADVNMDAVHLDQLPTYEASGQDPIAPVSPGSMLEEAPVVPAGAGVLSEEGAAEDWPRRPPTTVEPPNEPPPGYEETQQQSIQQEFDRRVSGQER